MTRVLPHLLLALSLLVGAAPSQAQEVSGSAVPASGPSALAQQIDRLMSRRYDANQPGGVVLVVKGGKTLFRKGYGLASLELGTPVDPSMVFRIGSITKQVTAAAILTLVEDGKLELNRTIGSYLEDIPEAWKAVTLEQLLTHTGGIPNHTETPEYKARMREDITPQELIDNYLADMPLDFPPGTQYRYSNAGYVLLGMLIEQVTEQPYGEYLAQRFFGPLGLKHMRYGSEVELIPGLVPGYTKGPKPCPYRSTSQAFASGGLISNADEVVLWLEALYAGKVLKPESLTRMMAPLHLRDGKEIGYGYGIGFRTLGKARLAGHAGGVPGFKSWAEAHPASRTFVVILNNTDSPKGEDSAYAKCILGMVCGVPVPEP